MVTCGYHQCHSLDGPVPQSLQLLKTLHSLLILDLADFPEKRRVVLSQYWDHIACEHLCTTLPDTGRDSCKHIQLLKFLAEMHKYW